MTDPAQELAQRPAFTIPKPSAIRPKPVAMPTASAIGAGVAIGPQPVVMPVPGTAGPQPVAAQAQGTVGQQPVVTSAQGTVGPQPVAAQAQGMASGPQPRAEARRATARSALETVLSGVRLGCRDRQFLSKLVHWDKRNAASVASLIWRARLAGGDEAALTPRQHELVMAALRDAAVYRTSGADAISCWDCDNFPAGRCADHARDADRAHAYAELAVLLSGRARGSGLSQPTEISGYRRRTPVAS
jgi:hypothetical protein